MCVHLAVGVVAVADACHHMSSTSRYVLARFGQTHGLGAKKIQKAAFSKTPFRLAVSFHRWWGEEATEHPGTGGWATTKESWTRGEETPCDVRDEAIYDCGCWATCCGSWRSVRMTTRTWFPPQTLQIAQSGMPQITCMSFPCNYLFISDTSGRSTIAMKGMPFAWHWPPRSGTIFQDASPLHAGQRENILLHINAY